MKPSTHAFVSSIPLRVSPTTVVPAITPRRIRKHAQVRAVASGWSGVAAAGLLGMIFGVLSTSGRGSACETCGGAGYLPCNPCGACGGSGRRRCPRCRGGGTGFHTNVAREPIPVRIDDGYRFKLDNSGGPLTAVGVRKLGGATKGGT